jgi:SAM-dependent methyltransferase
MTPDELFRRRARFDAVADVYDRARPGYPAAMITDLADIAGVGPGSRVLEIGCGTGQASLPIAGLGAELLAIELGPRMAELASRRLAGFPAARVVVADFDRWTPEDRFDVVFAATAFHWLDPATRIDRTANLLVPGGALATVATHHVAGGTESFFAEVQTYYRRFEPDWRPHSLPPAADVPYDTELGAGRYGRPVFRRYQWNIGYDTADYLDLLRTYSPTLALPPPAAEGLLRGIGTLVDGRYGGRIVKRYLTELRVAHRIG